jgi:hypothetical protein
MPAVRYHVLYMSKVLSLAAGVVLAALWSFGQEPPAPAQLAILMKFDVAPPVRVLDSMQHEVAQIFDPTGIHVTWGLLGDNDGSEVFQHVIVLRFRGACRTTTSLPELQPLIEDLELASAAVRDGKALPFAEVRCDRVSSFLRPWRKAGEAATLGIAMGRVIAHELFHMLTNTLTHGAGTLSRASVTPEELAGHQARFSENEIELFKKSVRH